MILLFSYLFLLNEICRRDAKKSPHTPRGGWMRLWTLRRWVKFFCN